MIKEVFFFHASEQSHIGFAFNKEAKKKRSVSDDMFPYQRMITQLVSQDFLSRAVDRDLS